MEIFAVVVVFALVFIGATPEIIILVLGGMIAIGAFFSILSGIENIVTGWKNGTLPYQQRH